MMNRKVRLSWVSSVVFCVLFASSSLFAVSLNFSGNFRTEGNLYSKENLGLPNTNTTKTFLSARALLDPKLVIDDHFSLNTQWSLLASPNFTTVTSPGSTNPSGAGALGQGQGGYVFGDPATASLFLNRAWLEWVSDFGVVRIGRMPVSWGYGLMYDAGTNVWDDFQTTYDRLEYRLHFGHLIGAAAYSKGLKLSTLGNDHDQDFYTFYLRYENPEQDVEAGVMYERQVRSPGQGDSLMTTYNPYHLPDPAAGVTDGRPPLGKRAPSPLSNNVLDLYVKKTVDSFTFGGEVAWLTGSATDFNSNGVEDSLNAFGLTANVTYEYHAVKAFLDFLYASGDGDLGSDHLNGFTVLHRNRRPGLILGRELLGNYYAKEIGLGSPVYYGSANVFSGVYYFRPGIRFNWSEAWASGLEVIVASKAAAAGGEDKGLGVEIDLGTDHAFYKNFNLGLNLGLLLPGTGLGVPNPSSVFAARSTASVIF